MPIYVVYIEDHNIVSTDAKIIGTAINYALAEGIKKTYIDKNLDNRIMLGNIIHIQEFKCIENYIDIDKLIDEKLELESRQYSVS